MIIDIPRRTDKGSNKGSVRKLAQYLEKENADKAAHQKEWFFNQDREQISASEVIEAIDGNVKGLKSKEAKFYLVNISPSQKELAQIGNDKEALKTYTRKVMDAYAKNFNRGLSGEDLLYFGKIEENRYYKGYDRAVKEGVAKQGDPKPRLQTHIHVIVSRKDKYMDKQLSPLTHHRATENGPVKGGFDRTHFYAKGEALFDEMTGYERNVKESFLYRNVMKRGTAEERQKMYQAVAVQEAKQKKIGPRKSVRLISALLRSATEEEPIPNQEKGIKDRGI